tara:strand:- start:113 stop:1399 length:1287 start_codon:yes stop_codon:yes gene_type:complete
MASNQAPIVDRIRIIPRPDDFLDRNVGNSGEVFFDKQSNTLRLYSGRVAGGFSVLTDNNISEHLTSSGVGVVEYAVTVGVDPDGVEAGNKYFIDGVYKPELSLVTGFTYIFNQNNQTNEFYPNADGATANIHPISFSADDANGELGAGTTYLTKVIYKLENDPVTKAQYIAGFAKSTQRSIQITITNTTPTTLYYFCTVHVGMGNTITSANPGAGTGSGASSISVSDTAPESPQSGNIWYNSTNGKFFVYVADDDSNQWVQPSFPTPTAITDLGIADGTVGQLLRTDGAGAFTFIDAPSSGDSIGNFTLAASVIDTDDSSGIVITPPVTTSSDLTVQNDLTVRNTAYANKFVSTSTGTPTIDSATTINLSSQDGTIVSGGPFRLPSYNNAQRDALSAVVGDIIYNTQDNKIQAYINGVWRRLDDSGIV